MIQHIYWYDYCNAKGFGTCSWKLRTPTQLKCYPLSPKVDLISEMPKCLPVWRNFGLGFAFPELFSEGSSFYKKQNYSVRDPRI